MNGNPKGAGFPLRGILQRKMKSQKAPSTLRKQYCFLPLFATLAGAVVLGYSAPVAKAATIFTESFSSSASNWAIDSTGTAATWVNTGGPKGVGDGYITRTTPLTGSTVLFRGQSGFNSSSGGFVGNWISEGVTTFTIDILQDSGSVLNFGLRFANSANTPGASTFLTYAVPSGVWTTISIPIADSSSVFTTYEGNTFSGVFSSIGNVQLSVSALPSTSVHVSIDNPTISSAAVPEPTSIGLLGMTGACGLFMRRRRR